MPYPLPLTRTEAYLAYKAGVIQQSDLKPSLAVPRNGIDAWLAYWTGLAADYPKREDGTPHILQEEEAYIAYLCGVIDTYPEECLRRVGAYLRYLISARWGRPDHPLNREELYLSLIKTQFIPSGDPSSDIVIDGTAKAPFVDVKMYGDTYQQTYTGKNLLNPLTFVKGRLDNGVVGYQEGTSALEATATDITFTTIANFRGITSDYIKVVSGRQYIQNQELSNDNNVGGAIAQYDLSKTFIRQDNLTTGTAITMQATTAYIRIYYFARNAGTITLHEPQLEAGATATSYEPYVGGTPSPNPDYPQQIQTVTGRQVVNVTGKNFLIVPTEAFTRTNGGVTWSYDPETQIYTFNGTTTADNITFGLPTQTHTIKAGSTLYTTIEYVGGSIDGALRLQSFESGYGNSAYVGITGQSSVSSTKQITSESVRIIYNMRNTAVGQKFTDFKIKCYMSIVDADYEPYSSNDYEINLGKNLFDKDNYSKINAFIDAGGKLVSNANNVAVYIPCEANTTYTISRTVPTSGNSKFGVGYATTTPAGGVQLYDCAREYFAQNLTVTTGAEATFLVAWVYVTDYVETEAQTIASLQIEKGSVATTYAPYFTPIELCKLGTYQDYIWKDGEDWKVHKATATITLDGTEAWVYAGNYNYARCPSYTFVDKPLDSTGAQLSNYFEAIAGWGEFRESTSRNAFYPLSDSGYKISIRNTGCTSVEDYILWLSTNKPSFYYPVATPTDTTITDTALIAQLEALVAGGAENGTTYIKVNATDPNLPAKLYVEAPKYD